MTLLIYFIFWDRECLQVRAIHIFIIVSCLSLQLNMKMLEGRDTIFLYKKKNRSSKVMQIKSHKNISAMHLFEWQNEI